MMAGQNIIVGYENRDDVAIRTGYLLSGRFGRSVLFADVLTAVQENLREVSPHGLRPRGTFSGFGSQSRSIINQEGGDGK